MQPVALTAWVVLPAAVLLGAASVGGLVPTVDLPPRADFPEVGSQLFVDVAGGDPAKLWGEPACEKRSRLRTESVGGDPASSADDAPQAAEGFRLLHVRDGDDFFGERCELGHNDHTDSPTALYRDGRRLITFTSLRLGRRFPLRRDAWQSVLQMKQAQPSDSGGGTPVLALHAYDGRWRMFHTGADGRNEQIWSAPARRAAWTRFAFDVRYSLDRSRGVLQVYVDLNGDGDAADDHERSPRRRLETLKREGAGDATDGLAPGDAIPSHLRVGIYHDPSYRCRRSECSVGVDNVGIYAPEVD